MASYKYLIIGGGMTGGAAAKGIREVDTEGSIALIGDEADPPYDRPPLSKSLWTGTAVDSVDSIWRRTEVTGADLLLGRSVTRLDPQSKRVEDDSGGTYGFDKLLLATGGTPRRLPFGGDRVIYFRTLDDYRRLRALADRGERFAVIGGGFIGSEIAAALAMNGKHVTMVFPEPTIGARVFPEELGLFVNDTYRAKGVELLAGRTVTGIVPRGSQFVVEVSDATEVVVDAVVAGLGIEPNVGLAQDAGLKTDDGIAVDEQLRTGHPDIWAAGDVASIRSETLDRRIRVEHEDNAVRMGGLAGRNMAGNAEPYRHLSLIYSDLFELGYEAVGIVDTRLETVIDWHKRFEEGVIYYLESGRVRGVLLWNVWERVEQARELIGQSGTFDPSALRGRIVA